MIALMMALWMLSGTANPRPVSAEMAEKWLPALIRSLQSEEVDVRRCAARALGRLGRHGTDALPYLNCAAYDCDSQVRRLAREAIALIDPKSVLPSWSDEGCGGR